MKKEKSIQADIEVLQSEIFTLSQYLKDKEMEQLHGERFRKMIKALTSAISWGEAMRDKPEMKLAGRTVCKKCNEIFQPILNKALKENKELKAEAKMGNIPYKEAIRLQKDNKVLRKRLDDWIYELAYYTEDEVATPEGVKKFVGKALEDKVKEIKELREDNDQAYKENVDLRDKLHEQIFKAKLQAQPNALKASEEKPKLSKLTLEEFITIACEYTPSIAKDSGQPEWNNGELIELFNALTEGHWLYINRPKPLSKQKIEIVLEEMGITDIVYIEMPYGEKKHYTIKDLAETIYNAQSEEKYCTCKKPKITLGQHTLRDYCDKCNKPIIQNEEDNK